MLIVMPSYQFVEHDTKIVRTLLRAAALRYGRVAGFDTGSWLLASAGLLDGCRATIHWDALAQFEETFPAVDVLREDFVIDQDRVTCRGAQTAFDLMLSIIAGTHGTSVRLDVADLLGAGSGETSAPVPLAKSRTVSKAVALMQANLEEPLTIRDLARHVGRSQRDLLYQFRQEFGASPNAVYRHLRLNRCRKLVEETEIPVSEIAVRSGYQNTAAMTRAFRTAFDETPQSLRRKQRNA